MHNPYSVTPRKPLTDKKRLQLFVEKKGICCICGGRIDGVKEMWDEHFIPLADGGTNDMANRDIAHDKCARQKTAKEAKSRSKLRKAAEHHYGASRAKTKPMPHGRRSRTKVKMNGDIVDRVTGEIIRRGRG